MALIKCPECGKDISNKAKACIHCGFPLTDEETNEAAWEGLNLKREAKLIRVAEAGGGRIKDMETGEIISFSPYEVLDGKLLHDYVDTIVEYEKVGGRVNVTGPPDAPENKLNKKVNTAPSRSRSSNHHNHYRSPKKEDGKTSVVKMILYLVAALVTIFIFIGVFGEDERLAASPPYVDWSKYAAFRKIGIQKSIDERSCIGLQKAYEASYEKGGMTDVMGFIDWHLYNIGCYK